MKYTYPYLAGAALGVLLFLSFYVTQHGLGASGGLQRVGSVAVKAVAPGHADRTPQWAAVAGGTRNPLDHWLVWSVVGVELGGLFSGLLARRAKPETQKGPNISRATRLVAALIGGLLVVWASVSFGCGILLAPSLNTYRLPFTEYPLGFWFAQQGSIYVFVLLIVVYVIAMNRLDRRFGVAERED